MTERARTTSDFEPHEDCDKIVTRLTDVLTQCALTLRQSVKLQHLRYRTRKESWTDLHDQKVGIVDIQVDRVEQRCDTIELCRMTIDHVAIATADDNLQS